MAGDTATWKDGITLGIALVGAILGVMNTWNVFSQRRVRLRVTPMFLATTGGEPFGASIEIINLSSFPLTIAELGFKSRKGKVVLTSPRFPDGRALPRRLESREAISAMFGPSEFGIPSVRLGSAYARTACGRTITGNSPAGRQFSRMIAELAAERRADSQAS
ncbi:MAG TPA: hypothetical protein VNF99_07845 [Stellaceae bacterium]|nr:hypothetical protein [Stellaceae bacterium]